MIHARALCALLLTTALPATAQPLGDFDLGELILTANATPVEEDRTGASVVVLDQEDLEEAGNRPLVEVLDALPGVSFAANGPAGTTGSLRVRGLGDQYLRVRIDGIDVSDPSGTQVTYNLGGLTAGGIRRIELLRGTQSAVAGSDAVAGVLNVVTLGGDGAAAAFEVGSRGTAAAALSFGRRFEGGAVSGSLTRVRSDGFSAALGGMEEDGYDSTRLTFGAERELGTVTVGANVLYEDATNAFDDGPSLDNPDNVADITTRGARVFGRLTTGAVEHEFSAVYTDIRRTSFTDGASGPFTFAPDGERTELRWDASAAIRQTITLNFGLDWTEETFDDGFNDGREIVRGAYAEALWAPRPDLDLALSLRHEDHSRFGGRTSGRLAAAYRPDEATVVRASFATGFRAPSLYELNAGGGTGNPDLLPEESITAEVGIERDLGRGSISATAFYTEVRDQIIFDFGIFSYRQIGGTSRTRGVELGGEYDLTDRVRLTAAAAYTDAETESGAPLPQTPERELALGLEADVTERLTLAGNARHAAGAFDIGGAEFDAYTVVDLRASYAVTDRVEAYLRVENALDEEYEVVRGYGTAGRGVFVGVRASF